MSTAAFPGSLTVRTALLLGLVLGAVGVGAGFLGTGLPGITGFPVGRRPGLGAGRRGRVEGGECGQAEAEEEVQFHKKSELRSGRRGGGLPCKPTDLQQLTYEQS